VSERTPAAIGPGAAAPFVAVLGPTASGKSALGLQLAEHLHGEIVSCDSMQVYRGMDIGTGKASAAERAAVAHHLLDLVDPGDPFHAARWAALARAAITDIAARGRLPIVVGGTGLYLRALVKGLFEAPPSDPAIRARHLEEAAALGVPALHDRLAAVDAPLAARILRQDLLRISRGLEVFEQTGVPLSELQRRAQPAASGRRFTVLLDPPMPALRASIEARVDAMMAAGFLDEVRGLHQAGFGGTRALAAIGYRQLGEHLGGKLPLADTVAAVKRATVAYARRQRTWFRKEERDVALAEAPRVADLGASIAAALEHRTGWRTE
jgi:tRNA dimethylallyltransferase